MPRRKVVKPEETGKAEDCAVLESRDATPYGHCANDTRGNKPMPLANDRHDGGNVAIDETLDAMPMNSGACVKRPCDCENLSAGSGDDSGTNGRLEASQLALAETKGALAKAQAELESRQKETDAAILGHKNALARALADFDNYRKRTERERQSWLRDGRAEAVNAVIDTIDNLERAGNALPRENREGIDKIRTSLVGSLEKLGMKEINPAGERFDPSLHEALMTGEADGVGDDVVIEVLAKGYSIEGKLLKPAKVKVSKSR